MGRTIGPRNPPKWAPWPPTRSSRNCRRLLLRCALSYAFSSYNLFNDRPIYGDPLDTELIEPTDGYQVAAAVVQFKIILRPWRGRVIVYSDRAHRFAVNHHWGQRNQIQRPLRQAERFDRDPWLFGAF